MTDVFEPAIINRLRTLNHTQRSIEKTSRALLKNKHLAKDIVKLWFTEFRLADDKLKLAFLHLVNDILMNGAQKAPQFIQLFEPVLPVAFQSTARLASKTCFSTQLDWLKTLTPLLPCVVSNHNMCARRWLICLSSGRTDISTHGPFCDNFAPFVNVQLVKPIPPIRWVTHFELIYRFAVLFSLGKFPNIAGESLSRVFSFQYPIGQDLALWVWELLTDIVAWRSILR